MLVTVEQSSFWADIWKTVREYGFWESSNFHNEYYNGQVDIIMAGRLLVNFGLLYMFKLV